MCYMTVLKKTLTTAMLCATLVAVLGCSKSTWKQIGDDSREAAETVGQVFEGAVKGAIEAVEKPKE